MVRLNSPQKILVIRLSSIGDILLATPLLRILRKNFPRARVDFIIKKKFEELLSLNPHIDTIYAFDETLGFGELRRIKKEIRNRRYDLIIDIHKNFRSRYWRIRSKAGKIVSYRKRAIPRFFFINFKWNFYRDKIPVYQRYLEALGIQDDGLGLEIYISPEARARIERELHQYISEKEILVALVPGAGYATKRWLPQGFAQTGDYLAQNFNAGVLLFGDGRDEKITHEISSLMKAKTLNLAGRLSLQETAAAMDRCQLVISNDTGLMHLATALKKKLVAIFGATTEELGFFPCAPQQIIVEKKGLKCRPCTHIGTDQCPRGHFKCMRDIPANEVITAARQLLNMQEAL